MKSPLKSIYTGLVVGLFLSLSLGQLQRFQITPFIAIYVHDIVVTAIVCLWLSNLIYHKRLPEMSKQAIALSLFTLWASFTLVIQLSQSGFLYLIRWIVLAFFPVILIDLYKRKLITLSLQKGLFIVLSTNLLSGLTQFIFFPDTRLLKTLGWDDHLNRLIGVYFDPGFTGILLILGVCLLLPLNHKQKVINRKKFLYTGLIVASIVATLLTYSRASMVSLSLVLFLWMFISRSYKQFISLVSLFLLILLMLPRQVGEGVDLARTQSIRSRIHSSVSAKDIFIEHPIAGVGFNNYRSVLIDDPRGIANHTGSPDNSYLFILATTGVVGMLFFGKWLFMMLQFSWSNSPILLLSLVAISSHAIFNNTWFYPFVLIWFGLVYTLEVHKV